MFDKILVAYAGQPLLRVGVKLPDRWFSGLRLQREGDSRYSS
jgi:hypothetical protein